ncbi:MAG TPA: hypothetical protein VLF19_11900 [Methylomirabilota bacterium]|nr:hypothetical protein [Methylomirabilota bacterium]
MASRTPPSDALAAWIAGRRWFATKTRRISAVVIEDAVPLGGGVLALARVTLDDGTEDRYALPLSPAAAGQVADALDDPAFCQALLDLVGRGGAAEGGRGELRGVPTAAFPSPPPGDTTPRRLGGEQSNTSVAFGSTLILKHFRRLSPGLSPEEEIGRFLTERVRFPHVPALCGHLEYRRRDGGHFTLGIVQTLIAGARDGWEWTLDALGDPTRRRAVIEMLARLGAATAALHGALASAADDPDFAPEPIDDADAGAWAGAVRAQLAAAAEALSEARLAVDLPVDEGLRGLVGATKIRHHGDFHLGQTLYREASGEPFIIDFEGEPLRPLAERRRKHTPLRDVAGMLRSIDYAAAAARPDGDGWADGWRTEAARAFTDAYRAGARGAPFVPASDEAFAHAVAVLVVEKAAYEIVYEANNRPEWVAIPRRGLLSAASALRARGAGAA